MSTKGSTATVINMETDFRKLAIVAQLEKVAVAKVEQPQFTLLVVNVTPQIAQQILTLRPTFQRKIRGNVVSAYAEDMRAGKWSPNGASIVINADFDLVDGQHRLSAVVASEVTLALTIVLCRVRGVENTIDIGRTRTPQDILRIGRTEAATISRQRQAAILWEACGFDREKRRNLTRRAAAEMIEKSDMLEAVKLVPSNAPAGIIGAFLAAYRKAPDQAVAFFNAALTGVHEIDGKHEPALRYLANWIIQARSQKSYAGDTYTIECTHRAVSYWNAYREGRQLKGPLKWFGVGTPIPPVI